MNLVILFTTVDKKSTARRLAEMALKNRMAGCVQIIPGIESHYVWKGKKEVAREFILLAKTTISKRAGLQKLWQNIHPYDCPELVSLSGRAASAYARWIKSST